MVEQQPPKLHVLVRFLLSLVMRLTFNKELFSYKTFRKPRRKKISKLNLGRLNWSRSSCHYYIQPTVQASRPLHDIKSVRNSNGSKFLLSLPSWLSYAHKYQVLSKYSRRNFLYTTYFNRDSVNRTRYTRWRSFNKLYRKKSQTYQPYLPLRSPQKLINLSSKTASKFLTYPPFKVNENLKALLRLRVGSNQAKDSELKIKHHLIRFAKSIQKTPHYLRKELLNKTHRGFLQPLYLRSKLSNRITYRRLVGNLISNQTKATTFSTNAGETKNSIGFHYRPRVNFTFIKNLYWSVFILNNFFSYNNYNLRSLYLASNVFLNNQFMNLLLLNSEVYTSGFQSTPVYLDNHPIVNLSFCRAGLYYPNRDLKVVSKSWNYSTTKEPGSRFLTNLLFNRYHPFKVKLRFRLGRPNVRPVYSHFFLNHRLSKKFFILITLGSGFGFRLGTSLIDFNKIKTVSLQRSRIDSLFLYEYGDKWIKASCDNHITSQYWANGLFKHSQLRGASYRSSRSLDLNGVWNFSLTQNLVHTFDKKVLVQQSSSFFKKTVTLWKALLYALNENLSAAFLTYFPLFKYLYWLQTRLIKDKIFTSGSSFLENLLNYNSQYSFTNSHLNIRRLNILPVNSFNLTIKRKVLKLIVDNRYLAPTTMYFYHTLVEFMEHFSGRRVFLKFNPFIINSLTFTDLARCFVWAPRVLGYQRILGHRIFVQESLKIFHIAIRYRDPTFLANWIKAMLYRMSFWKYRLLLRYTKFLLRSLFSAHFQDLDFKGVRFSLKGKVSVAGNARTRSVVFNVGQTSHSTHNNRTLSHVTKVYSFTGVMGFTLSFYF